MATAGGSPASGLRLRPARISDLATLVRHRREMHAELNDYSPKQLDAADPVYRRWIAARLRNRRAVAWIVEAGPGRPVGSGCVWLRDTQPRPTELAGLRPYLMSMYTVPGFRGRGVATMLASTAVTWSRSHGYARMTLHASKLGRGIYERLGFTASSEMRFDLSSAPEGPNGPRPAGVRPRRAEGRRPVRRNR